MTIIETKATLPDLESRIERGLETFVDVGLALLEIRDRRLYKDAGFSAFDAYCRERWNWGRNYADKVIAAAELGTIVPFANEAQARELAPLKDQPEIAREVMDQLFQEKEANQITANDVRRVVKQHLGVDDLPSPAKAKEMSKELNAMVLGSDGNYHTHTTEEGQRRKDVWFGFKTPIWQLSDIDFTPEELTLVIPQYQMDEIDERVGKCLRWLNAFYDNWKGIHEKSKERPAG